MVAIEAQSVSKRFLLRHNASTELKVRFLGLLHRNKRESVEDFWALKNVSLRIEHGEAVGLVGRNGSGKSTFLKLIAATHRPTSGRLLVARGARVSSMIELGVGFHPELTGRENVFLNAAIHGLSRAEIEGIYDAVVAYSGLGHFIDVPIKNYSSGMYMRLAFAISANLDPGILLLDEIFAVGDADFQQRCIGTVKRFLDEGKTIIFVSHAPSSVRSVCRRVCVLEEGELGFDGDVDTGLAFYDDVLAQRAAQPDLVERVDMVPVTEDEEEWGQELQRVARGGHWRETGEWWFEFLRGHGLEPRHHVLEIGCGTMAAAVRLLPFLEARRYYGVEWNRPLFEAGAQNELARAGIAPGRGRFLVPPTFDLSAIQETFDFAFAGSLLADLAFNDLARCLAGVVLLLRPAGRFYASWFENPDPANFEPIEQSSGVTTYSDRPPYHYPFNLIETVCASLGATVVRLEDPTHPRGERILAIVRSAMNAVAEAGTGR